MPEPSDPDPEDQAAELDESPATSAAIHCLLCCSGGDGCWQINISSLGTYPVHNENSEFVVFTFICKDCNVDKSRLKVETPTKLKQFYYPITRPPSALANFAGPT